MKPDRDAALTLQAIFAKTPKQRSIAYPERREPSLLNRSSGEHVKVYDDGARLVLDRTKVSEHSHSLRKVSANLHEGKITIGPEFYTSLVLNADGSTTTVCTPCRDCGGVLPDGHRSGCRYEPKASRAAPPPTCRFPHCGGQDWFAPDADCPCRSAA